MTSLVTWLSLLSEWIDGDITFIGDEKNDRGNEHEIKADDIFAGHIDFIISEIG
ncbi:MAG: hypothetical protein SO049_08200 [Prevotella sp.]|nr:hypothetical protein [Prevotella sp.]MDY4432828.1 hypothetical protein [Prevotella sp.]